MKDDGTGNPIPKSGPCLSFKSTRADKPRVRSPHSIAILRGHEFEGAYAFEVEAMQTGIETAHRDLVLLFGFQSPEQYFYAHLGMVPDATSSNVFEVNEAPRRRVGEIGQSEIQWGRGVWHKLRVECDGVGHVRVFVDDMKTPHFERDLGRAATGQIGFGSFDDAGAFRNLKVWTQRAMPDPWRGSVTSRRPARWSWRSSPFGDVVGCTMDAAPRANMEPERVWDATRDPTDPEAIQVLVEAGRRGQWAVLVDADRDGTMGSPGDRWTPTHREFSRWTEPGHMLALTDAAVTVDRIALRPLLEAGGGFAPPYRFRTSVPKRSRSEYLKEQYVRHSEGHSPVGPWLWGSDRLRSTADPRPVLWALTPSQNPESWRWDTELFADERVQKRLAEDFVLIRLDTGPRSMESPLIPFVAPFSTERSASVQPMSIMQRHGRAPAVATTELPDSKALLVWLGE